MRDCRSDKDLSLRQGATRSRSYSRRGGTGSSDIVSATLDGRELFKSVGVATSPLGTVNGTGVPADRAMGTLAAPAEPATGVARDLRQFDVLIAGQLVNSRTETLEEYLREHARHLAVIGLAGAYAPEPVGACRLYADGRLVRQFRLRMLRISRPGPWSSVLLPVVFATWLLAGMSAVVRLRRRFDLFIGISIFSACLGLLLRRVGVVRRAVYYCLDYYPPPPAFGMHWLLNRLFQVLDRWCVRSADMTWHLAPRLAEARARFGGVTPDRYRHMVVPLGYPQRLRRVRPFEEIERSTIGFVGTLSENQGLQLLVEALPNISARVPDVRVRIIGHGPYRAELERLVARSPVSDRFIFHGFIPDEEAVLDLLSRCAIGIAPWTSSEEDNSLYADPGKPKLYAFLGLPIVITTGPAIAAEIQESGAGIAVPYDRDRLAEAVIALLRDPSRLEQYRNTASRWAERYTSERLFDEALAATLRWVEWGAGSTVQQSPGCNVRSERR